MNDNQFVAMMPIISSSLCSMISDELKISEEEATRRLYGSKLYEYLEKEETKVWQYSTHMLFSLFLQGEQTGEIKFPDV